MSERKLTSERREEMRKFYRKPLGLHDKDALDLLDDLDAADAEIEKWRDRAHDAAYAAHTRGEEIERLTKENERLKRGQATLLNAFVGALDDIKSIDEPWFDFVYAPYVKEIVRLLEGREGR